MNKRDTLLGLIDLINDNIYSKRDLKGRITMEFYSEIKLAQKDYQEALNCLVWNYDLDLPVVAQTITEIEADLDILEIAEVYAVDSQKEQIRFEILSQNLGLRDNE